MNVEMLKEKIKHTKKDSRSIESLIKRSLNELGKALPSHLNAERLVRIALTAIRLNPELANCNSQSFLGALFQSAQLGLEPNIEGQAYLVPYKEYKNNEQVRKVQFIIGYKGYVELFYRHKLASCLDMQTVYENDTFEFAYGTSGYIKHIPKINNKGKVIAYYAIAKIKTGDTIFKVMSKEDCLEHGKTHSKTFDGKEFDKNSPWVKDFDAMCKKTVLIQLMKLLPKSIEMQKAIAMDNTTKSKVEADMFEVKDETKWV